MRVEEFLEYGRRYPVRVAEDLCGKELASFQKIALTLAFRNKFCYWLMCRGAGKTFLLALYSVLRSILYPKSTVIVTAGVFRQAKRTFDEAENHIIDESPVLKRLLHKTSHYTDQYIVYWKNKSKIIAIPLGKSSSEGEGAAGFHGHLVIDELWRVPEDTFDLILFPFLGTSKDPIKRMKLKKEGRAREMQGLDNSLLAASTAYYQFNHLYKRWINQLKKIENAEDKQVIIPGKVMQGDSRALVNFAWHDLPDGFIDEKTIEEVQDNPIVLRMMYENEFLADSDGPFKQSLFDNLRYVSPYYPEFYAEPGAEYVVGIDPARTSDYFGIVVIKVGPPHRIVYARAVKGKSFQDMGIEIRRLLFRFSPVINMVMDSGGGGFAMRDILNSRLETEEDDIIKEPILEKNVESVEGLKILELRQSDNAWLDKVNASILGSFQSGRLLIPLDEIDYSEIKGSKVPVNAYEQILSNIDTLVSQFVSIRIKSTAGGSPRWDTSNSKAKKDLYSATLFAYWGLRLYVTDLAQKQREQIQKQQKIKLPRAKIYRGSPFSEVLTHA